MDSLRKKLPDRNNNFSEKRGASYTGGGHIRIKENTDETKKEKGKFKVKKAIFLLLFFIFTAFVGYGFFIAWKIHIFGGRINVGNENKKSFTREFASIAKNMMTDSRASLKGENDGRINILLLGSSGDNNPGRNLTDTIMIASIDLEKRKVALLSLPRDLYVEVPKTGYRTKINAVYQYGLRSGSGVNAIKETIGEVTGLEMHYYLTVDYDGFKKAIDALDGVYVDVARDIYDTRYPGPNYSYETFELKKGYQKLDGQTALKYVRERHTDPEGDFGRAKRQQQVMQSAKSRAFSIRTVLNPAKISELLEALETNVKTDLSLEEMESLIEIGKDVDTRNITTKVVDAWKKDSLLMVSHIYYDNIRAFILVPRIGNYSQVREMAENIFEIEKLDKRKNEIEKENARIAISNRSGDSSLPSKIRLVLKNNLGMKNAFIVAPIDTATARKTTIFNNSSKEMLYTLDELSAKLPSEISAKSSDDFEGCDIVIVLGEDLAEKHEYEEDSLEEFRKAEKDTYY